MLKFVIRNVKMNSRLLIKIDRCILVKSVGGMFMMWLIKKVEFVRGSKRSNEIRIDVVK